MVKEEIKTGYFGLTKRENGIYYYYVYDEFGRRKFRSTGKKTRPQAMQFALERFVAGDILPQKKTFHKLSDYALNYWDYDTCPHIQSRIQRGGTFSKFNAKCNNREVVNHILPYFKGKLVEELAPKDIEKWLLALPKKAGLSAKTCNGLLLNLRAILDSCIDEGWITVNPARNVKPLIGRCKRRGCYTLEQVKTIFQDHWGPDYAFAASYLAACTGMRMGEIRALTRGQIHQDYIDVNASWTDDDGRKCTKSGYGRVVPISIEIYNMLMALALPEQDDLIFTMDNRKPIDDKAIVKHLYRRIKAVGIDREAENLTFHSFRHFFNTRLIASGLRGELTRAVIGHEDDEMTEHYLHLDVNDMESVRAVQRGIAM